MTVYVILIAAAVLLFVVIVRLIALDMEVISDEEAMRRYQEHIVKRERGKR